MAGPEYITLDPEFETILREVAADPDSALLRVPRPQRIRSLFDRGGPIGPRAAVLTKVERHLVQTHRNELAWLLRQAALVKLLEGPRGRLYASRYGPGGKEYPLVKPAELRRRAGEERGNATQIEGGECALDLVERCAADPFGDEPTAADLATAAFRLEPSDEARVLVAMDFTERNAPRTALRLVRDVLAFNPPTGVAESAWSIVGYCHSNTGGLEQSHQAYEMICKLDPERITAWMCRLFMCLRRGDREDALDASRTVNELAAGRESHVGRFLRSLKAQRREGHWCPTEDSARLAEVVKDRQGGTAGRIADVLA